MNKKLETKIGVVILDLDQEQITLRCLQAISRGTQLPHIVVVIENSDTRVSSLDNINLNIIVLHPGKNLGCAGGRNMGINYLLQNTESTYFIVFDNDVIIKPDFIERVVALDVKNMEVIAPVIQDAKDYSIWSCGGIIHENGTIEQLKKLNTRTNVVDWAPGACLIMTVDTWRTIGEFDSWMNFLYEDIQWCLRLKKAGGTIKVQDDLVILHDANQSLGGEWSPFRVKFWARNGTVFRLCDISLGFIDTLKWLSGEGLLAIRDLVKGYVPWSIARFQGLAEGLQESWIRSRKNC